MKHFLLITLFTFFILSTCFANQCQPTFQGNSYQLTRLEKNLVICGYELYDGGTESITYEIHGNFKPVKKENWYPLFGDSHILICQQGPSACSFEPY